MLLQRCFKCLWLKKRGKKSEKGENTKGLIDDVLHVFDVVTCAQGQIKRQIIKS